MITPPIVAVTVGSSCPTKRYAHTGLSTGSMTVIMFASSTDMFFSAVIYRIYDNPSWNTPKKTISSIFCVVISTGFINGNENINAIKQPHVTHTIGSFSHSLLIRSSITA